MTGSASLSEVPYVDDEMYDDVWAFLRDNIAWAGIAVGCPVAALEQVVRGEKRPTPGNTRPG